MASLPFLHEAYLLAELAAQKGEVPVGAVVVKDGLVVGRGYNLKESTQNPISHAEMNALQDASKSLNSWRLLDCDLYVTLEPCPMCLSACQQARVKRVIYGAKDEKGGAICLGLHAHEHPKLNHQFEVIFEESEECSQILKTFFKNRRNEIKAAK